MNDADLAKVCGSLAELAVTDVLVTGGEIFEVRDVIPTLVRRLKELDLGLSFSLARLKERQFVDELLSFRPRAINVSLDPRDRESPEAYAKLVSQVAWVLERAEPVGVSVKVTGVITARNVANFPEYIATIRDMKEKFRSLSSVYVTNPYEIGYLKQKVRAPHGALSEVVKQVQRDAPECVSLVNFHRHNMPLQRCEAGTSYVHVEPNGDVYPCHLFANLNAKVFMMGNVLADRLNEIASRLALFGRQAQQAISEYKSENAKCGECTVQAECGGGCLAEIISAGNLIEPQLICRAIPPPKSARRSAVGPQLALRVAASSRDLTADEHTRISEHVSSQVRKQQHDLAHGWDHVQAVVRLGRHIATKENADLRVVTAAAYFHDFAPRQKLLFENHTRISAEHAVRFLGSIGFAPDELDRVFHCIDTSSYGSAELGHAPSSLEARVVRDADWLDSIGARGIARVFAFGAAHGCETLGDCEWDPDNPPKKQMSLVGPDPSPMYHFFSKLLWVKDGMQTETGKELALKRHARLVQFLRDYREETSE